MSIPVDDEKIFSLYQEGKLSNLAKVGSMAAVSMLGNPNTTMADTTYNDAYSSENMNVLTVDTVVDLWAKYYQTDNDKTKKERARNELQDGIDIPSNAKNAINTAVYIFGGDEGVSPNVLNDLLIYTGEIESLYKTRKQYGDGPARGYWQVEPQTAIDLLINSKVYFGKKFQKTFGTDLLKITKDTPRNREVIGNMILKNDHLAATFAAAKWISVADRAGLKDIRN